MVNFSNVTFDSDWIYAEAYDHDFNVSGNVKVHRRDELFETDCESTNQFRKAAWRLQDAVARGKVKQHGMKCVAWG